MLHHAVLMDQRDATVGYRGSKLDAQSALENLSRSGPLFVDGMAMPHSRLVGNLKEKQPVTEGSDNMARSSLDQHGSSWSSLCAQPEPYGFEREKACLNGTEWESTLFSSSMSEFFSRKSSDAKTHQSGEVAACQNQELVESLEEIEAQTIGNLLPAEDDLFSGVTDVLRCASPANGRDDLEDFDLFSSVGGLELEGDERLRVEQKHSVRKQMNLEAGRLGGARSLMQHSKQETNETNSYQIPYGGLSSGRMGYPSGVMGSSYNNNGSSQILHPTLQSPVGGFIDRNQSSSVPNNLPSPLTMGYTGKQFGLGELNHSLNELKLINHGDPNFHPHSLPEFHESIANGIPYSTSAIGGHSSVGLNMASQIAGRNIGGVGSNGHLIVRSGQVFGSSGNGSSTLPGNHYMWNNSESGTRYRSPNGLIWQNTSFANKVNPHHFQPMPGFPRSPSVVLSTVPSHPHVGSAPVNHSVWDRRHTFSAESPDASNLHLGSLGSVGLPGSSPRPLEIAPHSLFYNAGGMDVEKNVGICSPQQMSHMFPGRNQMISLSGSFESRNERVRNLSHRRSDSNPSHESKKQYELDIDCILRGDDSRTTLMIKNIPNKYTSKMLLAAIDEYCRGTYDFIYLPIDFKNKCNVGYAFINMIDPQQIIPFYKAFSGKKWEKFNSEKVASLAYARIQGKAALIAHFQNSSLMNEDKRCRPILFHTDGPNAGDPEPFPMGTNIRSRLGKPRSSGNEENNLHAAPSSFVNGEDTSNEPDPSSGSD